MAVVVRYGCETVPRISCSEATDLELQGTTVRTVGCTEYIHKWVPVLGGGYHSKFCGGHVRAEGAIIDTIEASRKIFASDCRIGSLRAYTLEAERSTIRSAEVHQAILKDCRITGTLSIKPISDSEAKVHLEGCCNIERIIFEEGKFLHLGPNERKVLIPPGSVVGEVVGGEKIQLPT